MPQNTPYFVFGGELVDTQGVEFREPDKLDIVGIFVGYDAAFDAWRGKAQRTVDTAIMRYFIVPLDGRTLADIL